MLRILLPIPLVFITFAIGLFISPYDSASGVRGAINALAAAIENRPPASSSLRVPGQYFGRWGGVNGDVIYLDLGYITDVEMGKTYQYRVVSRTNNGTSYLLELTDFHNGSNLRKYVYLGFEANDSMNYFGYDSVDDYNFGRASAAGGFFKTPLTR